MLLTFHSKMLTRAEFVDYWNKTWSDQLPIDDASPIWNAENYPGDEMRCEYFVCVKPVIFWSSKDAYWEWCTANTIGGLACFSSNSDDQEEWWGFTNKDDIFLWMLRWSK